MVGFLNLFCKNPFFFLCFSLFFFLVGGGSMEEGKGLFKGRRRKLEMGLSLYVAVLLVLFPLVSSLSNEGSFLVMIITLEIYIYFSTHCVFGSFTYLFHLSGSMGYMVNLCKSWPLAFCL